MSVTFSKLGNFGRLGNQLFQIAATVGHAYRQDDIYKLPDWKYKSIFNGPFYTTGESIFHTYKEPHFHYAPIPLEGSWDLEGYFQSIKYWDELQGVIKGLFAFDPKISKIAKDFIVEKSKGKIPVSVHVRRGDYITMAHYYHNLSPEWYYKAMHLFNPYDHHFFIMSDDPQWCVENIYMDCDKTFCNLDEVNELCIMTECDHHIIANSSYSWWGSYLGHNPDKKIIAPSKNKWFKPVANHNVDDLYLKSWVLL